MTWTKFDRAFEILFWRGGLPVVRIAVSWREQIRFVVERFQ